MATAAGGDRVPEPGLPASAAFDDLLECPICLQCLQLPTVVTPCGHTYCRNCLQASYGGRSSIRCPVCTAALPELTRLPENFMLNAIIEAMAQCQAQADVPTPEAILLPDGRIRVTWRRRPGAQRANKYQLEEWVDGSASGYAPKDIRADGMYEETRPMETGFIATTRSKCHQFRVVVCEGPDAGRVSGWTVAVCQPVAFVFFLKGREGLSTIRSDATWEEFVRVIGMQDNHRLLLDNGPGGQSAGGESEMTVVPEPFPNLVSILGGNHYHPTYTLVPCRRPDSFYITIAAYDLKMWLEVDASTHVSTVMNRVQDQWGFLGVFVLRVTSSSGRELNQLHTLKEAGLSNSDGQHLEVELQGPDTFDIDVVDQNNRTIRLRGVSSSDTLETVAERVGAEVHELYGPSGMLVKAGVTLGQIGLSRGSSVSRRGKRLRIYVARRGCCMQIFIKGPDGRTSTIDVAPATLVETLRLAVEAWLGIPSTSELQRLIFRGKQLDDSRTLQDYEIVKESTLHLVLRLRGSDARLKTNILPVQSRGGLEAVTRLQVVHYNYKAGIEAAASQQHYHVTGPEVRHLGFIAQQVATVLPEAVHRSGGEEGMLLLSYEDMLPSLVLAVQELQRQVQGLRGEHREEKEEVVSADA